MTINASRLAGQSTKSRWHGRSSAATEPARQPAAARRQASRPCNSHCVRASSEGVMARRILRDGPRPQALKKVRAVQQPVDGVAGKIPVGRRVHLVIGQEDRVAHHHNPAGAAFGNDILDGPLFHRHRQRIGLPGAAGAPVVRNWDRGKRFPRPGRRTGGNGGPSVFCPPAREMRWRLIWTSGSTMGCL